MAVVHREALRVLRPVLEEAHLDAYSDGPWPPEVLPSYQRALSLAREAVADGTRARRSDPGMGIDIDVRDDEQFAVLSALLPYTIHAEGRRGSEQVFGAGDSGTSLWFVVTREQEAQLLSRLEAQRIASTALAVLPAKGRRAGALRRPG
ncbi:hypothetical protein [Streptomyces sp. NPDC047079]|uniref:hypothetical protein n=1 Tax=Streptomyces sp. NPDC047079 TaxID=3154607 RepID=UPI0033C69A9D